MSFDPNDPRLTAYALGELNETERQAFEAEVSESPAALAEIADIRATARLLTEGLGQRAPQTLTATQRSAIERASAATNGASSDRDEAAQRGSMARIGKATRRRTATWLAAGGAAVAMAAGAVLFVGTPERAVPVASPNFAVSPAAAPGVRVSLPSAEQDRFKGDLPMKRQAKGDDSLAPDHRTESYDHFTDNPFIRVAQDPRSTFSVDVDTASYALVRRHLTDGNRPPPGAVRIEEMINYFKYGYAEPTGNVPFSVNTEVSSAPWAPSHQLVRIGIKGKHVAPKERPRANLVFLLDVSGSMSSPDKLPLLKQGLNMLVNQLDEGDRVSIAVYAGASGLVLPPTPGSDQRAILDALNRLEAGGSTNGGEGIRLAYEQARAHFVQGGINRVILATDGDFNVGTTSESELVRLIEEKAKGGVFLSVLGFGSGNYQDFTLEKLADKGNGNYAYIDSAGEARKVLVEQASGTLMTIAKDVKIQLEMNPARVEAFRLIGYENRVLGHQDFADDQKDAGEIGANHTVTALYEIVPKGQPVPNQPEGSMLRYQKPAEPTAAARSGELLTIKLRYKQPDGDASREIELQVRSQDRAFESASSDHQFAAAIAAFGMLLRNSEHKGSSSFGWVLSTARRNAGGDPYRSELVELVRKADELTR